MKLIFKFMLIKRILIITIIGLYIILPLSSFAQNKTNNDTQLKCLTNGNCSDQGGLMQFIQNSNYTLPLIALAGLVDGINPCAIGMLILLLGYLMVFAKKPELMKKIGVIYILTIFITYILIGVIFTQTISYLINLPHYQQISDIIKNIIIILIIIAALINLKDVFWYRKGITLGVTNKQVPVLLRYIKEVSIGATIILGVLVTLFELPCSLPLYLGTITILSGFYGFIKVGGYLLIYNLMFILPITVIFIILMMTRKIFAAKDLQERSNRYLKLIASISQIIIAIILYFL